MEEGKADKRKECIQMVRIGKGRARKKKSYPTVIGSISTHCDTIPERGI